MQLGLARKKLFWSKEKTFGLKNEVRNTVFPRIIAGGAISSILASKGGGIIQGEAIIQREAIISNIAHWKSRSEYVGSLAELHAREAEHHG